MRDIRRQCFPGCFPGSPGLAIVALVVALLAVACGGEASSAAGASAGATTAPADAPVSLRDLAARYTRYGPGPYDMEIDLTYVPPAFLTALGLDPPDAETATTSVLFLLRESVHEGDLTEDTAEVFLRLPDGELIAPSERELAIDDYHHRTYRVRFPVEIASLRMLELAVSRTDGTWPASNPFRWDLVAAEEGSTP